ncbi:MAG: glycosyltransferase family 2 protein [Pseudomonadota bacterium]
MAEQQLHTRWLLSQGISGATVLDHIAWRGEKGHEGRVYLAKGTDLKVVRPASGTQLKWAKSVGGAILVAYGAMKASAPPPLVGVARLAQSKIETDLFEGLKTFVSTRNGESAETVAEWLWYHATRHGLEGAVIIDRTAADPAFDSKLERALTAIPEIKCVVVLRARVPLGREGLPSEGHPFCAPAAPGKDRMEVPPEDRWTSPLDELLVYEIARTRFLAKAKAVCNIDVYDIIPPEVPLFEEVDKRGSLILIGRRTYPWRVRKGQNPTFGDHTCMQFDTRKVKRRWAIKPSAFRKDAIWRLLRVVGKEHGPDDVFEFYSMMNLRHPVETVSRIVPKTSLIEQDKLVALATDVFRHQPVRVPDESIVATGDNPYETAIVTCMKNEGPFILEWLAYHRVIGVERFLVYTNDCDDGTDTFLDLLQSKGLVEHRENPFRGTNMKPQHAALHAAEKEPVITSAAWAICMDVDEYICVHCGDGTLKSLYDAIAPANMISLTWRLFGNANVHEYNEDDILIEKFDRCAREFANKPHQAWGFKTIFRHMGIFKKLGVHRPKGLKPQLKDNIYWVNGSGSRMPETAFRNTWRSTSDTYGYELATLNHYAVRSAESFLVKRDRGRVNHVDRDQGLAYWFRMNNNEEEDRSIHRMVPALRAEMERLLSDPDIAAQHQACVAAHRAKIDALRATDNYASFYQDLTGSRMEKLAKMHKHFGANVFLAGPHVVPDNVLTDEPEEDLFFTVDRQETQH